MFNNLLVLSLDLIARASFMGNSQRKQKLHNHKFVNFSRKNSAAVASTGRRKSRAIIKEMQSAQLAKQSP
jgi:hypothetical protein